MPWRKGGRNIRTHLGMLVFIIPPRFVDLRPFTTTVYVKSIMTLAAILDLWYSIARPLTKPRCLFEEAQKIWCQSAYQFSSLAFFR